MLWDQVLDWQRSNVVSTVLSPCARNGVFRFFDNVINGNAAIPNSSTQARSVDAAGNPVSNLGPLRYASVFGQLPANLPPANADCSNIAALVTRGAPWDPNRTDFDSTGYVKKLVNPDFMPAPNRWDVGDGLNTAGFTWVRRVRGNGDLGGVSFQGTDQLNRRQINGKIDHDFNTRHKVAFGYTYEYTYSEGQNVQLGLPAYPNSAPASKAYRRPHVFTTNFTSTLTSNMVNEARVGLRRTANESAPQTSDSLKDFFFDVNGYSVLPRLGSGTALSATSTMPFQNAVFNYFTPSRNAAPFWTYGDTLSWSQRKTRVQVRRRSSTEQSDHLGQRRRFQRQSDGDRADRDGYALRSGLRHCQQHAIHVGRLHSPGRHRNNRQRSRHAPIVEFPLRIDWQRHTELLPEFIPGSEVVGYQELALSATDDAAERVQFLCERRLESATKSDAQSRRPLGLLRSSVGSERHDSGSRRRQQRGLWIFRTII